MLCKYRHGLNVKKEKGCEEIEIGNMAEIIDFRSESRKLQLREELLQIHRTTRQLRLSRRQLGFAWIHLSLWLLYLDGLSISEQTFIILPLSRLFGSQKGA